jgi:CBS domain-containing protein
MGIAATTLPSTVREIMSRHVVTVDPDMSLRDAIGVLDANGISGAPVVTRGRLVGVLSATDILGFVAATPGVPTEDDTRERTLAVGADEPRKDETNPVSAYFTDIWDNAGADVLERMRSTENPEWDVLAEHVVSEVMSPGVRSVQAGATLAEVASYMLEQRIHRTFVMDRDELIGVVSAMDFLRAVARAGTGEAA